MYWGYLIAETPTKPKFKVFMSRKIVPSVSESKCED
jgi:hypothetical protein